jgi:hypothetical protein
MAGAKKDAMGPLRVVWCAQASTHSKAFAVVSALIAKQGMSQMSYLTTTLLSGNLNHRGEVTVQSSLSRGTNTGY